MDITKQAGVYLFLALLTGIFIYPIMVMVINAFKPTAMIFQSPLSLPNSLSLSNLTEAWERANFSRYLQNSLVVAFTSTALLLACASPAAYALARYRFRVNNSILLFFLAGIMIPLRLGIVPLFVLMKKFGFLNSPLSLIFTYAASGMPMSVFLLSNFFRTLPRELEDAARIDGCSEFKIFYKVMLPLVRPGLATVVIMNVVPWWNDFFFPLLFIQSDRWKTIPLGMQIFFGQHLTDWGLVFAGMVLASVPLLVIYVFMSRQFIAGLTGGALKG